MTLPTMILNADGSTAVAVLEPVGAPTDAAPVVYTAGQVLAEWRAAERRLDAIPDGTAEWRPARHDIDVFRRRYQAMFKR
ncbi:MAG TPA: hypothetical protein VFP66_12415 [Candidatus Limnocylindrales bacterium]|nr:hypothetical protein [Candidatus Limnocylindrales bacterium]